MIIFPCSACHTPLSANKSQIGAPVRCPTCDQALTVPTAETAHGLAVAAAQKVALDNAAEKLTGMRLLWKTPRPQPKRYGFNCSYCSSRLEASPSMAAQEGQCPTCGNTIIIPLLDTYGRLIDPTTNDIVKQDPHPVHTYAAAGDRAPLIVRRSDGVQVIQCPRCSSVSPISNNNCKTCGMPFTMEGTTNDPPGVSNGYCVAALTLGVIGIPGGCTMLIPALGVIFGIVGLKQLAEAPTETTGRGMAIAGIICGSIGLIWGLPFVMRWF